ncbi:MAG: SDR family NAD(P)-dependent oxidoreductase, partial [Bacillota bacterium]|nr:SDR family NAD(P)-dependent oxidoreductase [Bacillota bacterium]
MKNLYGKVVLVTGASSGLGLAVANYLYQKGFNVYAGARSFKAESIERNSEGGILHKINLDVTDQTSVGSVLKHITEQENTLDVLVNCAAYLVLGSVEETSFDEYNLVLNTNLYGALRMIKGVLPDMRQHKCGLIVNFSSINGLLGIPYQSAYVASKFAIEGMSECLSLELKNFGV